MQVLICILRYIAVLWNQSGFLRTPDCIVLYHHSDSRNWLHLKLYSALWNVSCFVSLHGIMYECVCVCARMRPMCETSWLLSIKSREKKTSRTWQVDKNYSSFTPHTRGYTEGTEMSVLNGCLWCTFSLLLQTALHLFWVLPCHVFPAIITLCQSCVV